MTVPSSLPKSIFAAWIEAFELHSPFLLRSYEPRLEEVLACLNPTSRRPLAVLLLGQIYLVPEQASDGL